MGIPTAIMDNRFFSVHSGRIHHGYISSGVLLKVLDGIGRCRKPVNATDPILWSFNERIHSTKTERIRFDFPIK